MAIVSLGPFANLSALIRPQCQCMERAITSQVKMSAASKQRGVGK